MADENKSKDAQTGSSSSAKGGVGTENKGTKAEDNQVRSSQETMPSVGAGISGTGSSNPTANAKETERREAASRDDKGAEKKEVKWDDFRSLEARTKTEGTTGSQPKAKEGKFVEDENNTLLRVDTDKEGKTTVISTVDNDTFVHDKKLSDAAPEHFNQTQAMHGVPGEVNLTADGALQGDKSLRQEQTEEELNQERELVAGANPIPNREGNELTKAANGLSAGGPQFMFQLDAQTNKMADKLSKIRAKGTLSADDKRDLETMEQNLRQTGRM